MVVTMEETRVCPTCGAEKPITEFSKTDRWYRHECRVCSYTAHPLKETTRVCPVCGKEKPIGDFNRSGMTRRRICWPCQYDREKEKRKQRFHDRYYDVLRPNNLAQFGVVYTPEQKEQVRERIEQRQKEFGCTYTPKERAARLVRYIELRTKVLGNYGGKCECCGEARYEMLTFDHIHKESYKTKLKGLRLLYDAREKYRESGYPNGIYQVLCWNCNTSKGYYGYCPHTGQARGERNSRSNRGWNSKMEMIKAYGDRCELCGESAPEFLTIDHINGGGDKHRGVIGNGETFRRWLKRQGWPKDEYRLLCANCNCSLKRNGWTTGSQRAGFETKIK